MLPWVISGTSAPYSKNTKLMPISTCRSYSYSTKGTFRCFFTIRDVIRFTGHVILLRAATDKLEQQSAFKNRLLKLSAPDIKYK